MEILLLALTVGVPLIKFILFPARTMGRGGNWTIVGAAMIVGLMMVLWFAMQSLSDTASDVAGAGTAKPGGPPAQQQQQTDLPDLDGLTQLL
jgi:hypothetical protein